MAPFPTAESELLVLGARVRPSPQERGRMRGLLERGILWDRARADARRLGVEALLFRRLSRGELSRLVPDEPLDGLKKASLRLAASSLRLHHQLDRMLEAIGRTGTPVIPLKGALLARTVYGDVGLRPMTDIDLLVRPADRDSVTAILTGLGYSSTPGKSDLHERIACQQTHVPPFTHPDRPRVEVHLNLYRNVPIESGEMDRVWGSTGTCEVQGQCLTTLSPEDQLLYLTTHLYRHATRNTVLLYWFTDIHEILAARGTSLDWDRFLSLAARVRAAGDAAWVLASLHRYWNTPIPAEVLAELAGRDRAGLDFFEALGRLGRARRPWSVRYRQAMQRADSVPGSNNRVRFLWHTVFPRQRWVRDARGARTRLTAMVYPLVRLRDETRSFCSERADSLRVRLARRSARKGTD